MYIYVNLHIYIYVYDTVYVWNYVKHIVQTTNLNQNSFDLTMIPKIPYDPHQHVAPRGLVHQTVPVTMRGSSGQIAGGAAMR